MPPADLDAANERLLDLVNQTGDVFLSHTKLREGVALRLAIGHLDTTERHVRRALDLLVESSAGTVARRAGCRHGSTVLRLRSRNVLRGHGLQGAEAVTAQRAGARLTIAPGC